MTAPTRPNDSVPAHRVYLGLGSNLGDRDANLRAALARLAADVRIERVSSVYDTAPMHIEDQPRFHNIVCEGWTDLTPEALLRLAKDVEAAVGRTPSIRYGPRAIDIDVLLYDDLQLTLPDLIIPHPRLWERAFVLAPLAEIAPRLRHPELDAEIAELARQVEGQDVRRLGLLFTPPT